MRIRKRKRTQQESSEFRRWRWRLQRAVPIALCALLPLSWLLPERVLSHLRRADRLVTAGLQLAYGRPAAPSSRVELVHLHVDTAGSLTQVDPRFVSVALDTSLVVGGRWWSKDGHIEIGRGTTAVEPFDWKRAGLRELARDLSPAYLRVGGTEADHTFYDMSYEVSSAALPKGYELRLTRSQWDALTEFTRSAKLDLMFTLNAGPGPRNEAGQWQADNAKHLLEYARSQHDDVAVWELGNEINGYWFIHGLGSQPSAEQYASDLRRLDVLTEQLSPSSRTAGPSSAFFPVVGEPLGFRFGMLDGVLHAAGSAVDIVTWHYYPQQSRRCPVATRPATTEQLLNPAYLAEVESWATRVRRAQLQWAPQAEIWLGETGNAQCGGEPGVSDRYVSGLWWLDQLGRLARLGQKVVIRQALVGANYGLLDEDTLEPRPDYFHTLLWKQLMGQRVLAVDRDGENPYLRSYAHCSARTPGAVTLLLINTHPELPAVIRLSSTEGQGRAFVLSAAELRSRTLRLNGASVRTREDFATVADGTPYPLTSSEHRLGAAESMFLELPGKVPACSPPS